MRLIETCSLWKPIFYGTGFVSLSEMKASENQDFSRLVLACLKNCFYFLSRACENFKAILKLNRIMALLLRGIVRLSRRSKN